METFEPGWRADMLLLGEHAAVLRAGRALKRALRLKGDVKMPAPLSDALESLGTGVWLPSLFEAPARRPAAAPLPPAWPHRAALTRLLSKFTRQHPSVILAAVVRLNPSHPGYSSTKAAQAWVSGWALGTPRVQSLSLQNVSGFLQTGDRSLAANWGVLWRAPLVRDELMGEALAFVGLDDVLPPVRPAIALQPPLSSLVDIEEEEALAWTQARR